MDIKFQVINCIRFESMSFKRNKHNIDFLQTYFIKQLLLLFMEKINEMNLNVKKQIEFQNKQKNRSLQLERTLGLNLSINLQQSQNQTIKYKNQTKSKLESSNQQKLDPPFPFLMENPPYLTCINTFFPFFQPLSLTFILTIIFLIVYFCFIIIEMRKEETQVSHSCLLFNLQNKFLPIIKENYQIQRLIVCFFFHSSIDHIIINIIAINIYGYSLQKFHGWNFRLGAIMVILYGGLLSCIIKPLSVSVTASAFGLYIIALQIGYLYKHFNYPGLENRRVSLIFMLVLVFGLNFITLFTNVNVDLGGHFGGFIVGLLCNIIFWEKQGVRYWKVVKILGLLLLFLLMIGGFLGIFMMNLQGNEVISIKKICNST